MVEIFIFILINGETVKIETGSKLGFAIVATSRLRAESFKLSVWLQEWLHAEVGKARRNCDLYVFSASRKHFISTHSLPTVFIRANPHRPPRPLREIRSPPFQICSLPIATIGTIASYPDRGLHSPPGKGLSAPLRRGQSRSGRDTLTGGGRPRAICVNIPTYFELWSLAAAAAERDLKIQQPSAADQLSTTSFLFKFLFLCKWL